MGSQTKIAYAGSELELFANAKNWKRYLSYRIRQHIVGNVIEVGAGLGSSTKFLCTQTHGQWLCLDPDPAHARHLAKMIGEGVLNPCCEARCGVLSDLRMDECADTILYIDVLEHIERDEEEIRLASERLLPRGRIVVLSPAFSFLYSPFDQAIGHHRRYHFKDVDRLTVPGLFLREAFFLDSIGFFASAFNRLIANSAEPSSWQIHAWDESMVPLSRFTDKIFGRIFGRSIVFVWEKR